MGGGKASVFSFLLGDFPSTASNRPQWEPLFPFPSGRHVAQIGDIRVVFSAQFSSMNFVEHENGEPARKYFKMMKIAFFVVLNTETVNRWYFLVWGAK